MDTKTLIIVLVPSVLSIAVSLVSIILNAKRESRHKDDMAWATTEKLFLLHKDDITGIMNGEMAIMHIEYFRDVYNGLRAVAKEDYDDFKRLVETWSRSHVSDDHQ